MWRMKQIKRFYICVLDLRFPVVQLFNYYFQSYYSLLLCVVEVIDTIEDIHIIMEEIMIGGTVREKDHLIIIGPIGGTTTNTQ